MPLDTVTIGHPKDDDDDFRGCGSETDLSFGAADVVMVGVFIVYAVGMLILAIV